MNRLLIWHPAYELWEARIRACLTTEWDVQSATDIDNEWLVKWLPGADALLALQLPEEGRELATGLKALLYPGAGVMHTRGEELPLGCVLANVYEHEIPIAEFVLMTVLMQVTRIRSFSRTFSQGDWEGSGRTGGQTHDEAFGKTIGLIGFGSIGRAVASRAGAFGMRVEAIRRGSWTAEVDLQFAGGQADLDGLLERSDFVVVCCPLTKETHGMLGVAELAKVRDGALLINVARAEIIDECALYSELLSGRFSAALDVWYRYPVSTEESLHGSRFPFHELDNVLATPHFSAWTDRMINRRAAAMAANLDRLARGQELESVVLRGAWTR